MFLKFTHVTRRKGGRGRLKAREGSPGAGSQERPAYPLNNARADKLGAWPWKAVQW